MGFRYEDLDVGEDILKFIDSVYATTATFPTDEKYGLTSQLRRAVYSVYLNLAEGSARGSKKEFARYITIALASLVEVHAAFKIALKLSYIDEQTWRRIEVSTNILWKRLCSLRSSQK